MQRWPRGAGFLQRLHTRGGALGMGLPHEGGFAVEACVEAGHPHLDVGGVAVGAGLVEVLFGFGDGFVECGDWHRCVSPDMGKRPTVVKTHW